MISTKRRIKELENKRLLSDEKQNRICIIDPITKACRASFVRTASGYIDEGGAEGWVCPDHGIQASKEG